MILRNLPILPCITNTPNPKQSTRNPTHSLSLSSPLFQPTPPNATNQRGRLPTHLSTSVYGVVRYTCVHIHCRASSFSSSYNIPKQPHFILELFILFIFSLTLLCLRLASSVLLPNFPHRWHQLVAFSEQAEAQFGHYPSHLWQAVVAYEDRRFFRHFGIDPVGIGRAVFSFSARGGGSTITQQLVKNTFLKNERTFSRKVVEMLLALALERTISKLRILSSYLYKIYWGHGIYGVEMASKFYFGKHPAILSLGECAILAGMIPAPELRSPLRNSIRGKTFQARVLKRMVEVGFLDIKTALLVVKQSLHIRVDDIGRGSGLLLPSSSLGKGKGDKHSNCIEIWDWERASMIWEAVEDMERWVLNIQKGTKELH
ncbi:uncharacterized protein LOC131334029 isoform X1 [Rhododendron vialii]|uniref:uncharacterized protein LOC131334029 isoform X1 n=1 Tax=Rhododendron vialii TaxID=182163 RepID=UPI00265E9D92|nr:uncharacterized protein LOC131334029 isoform X1 [Rhododendron vialii]